MPQDFESALRRMKVELALTELRRGLLDPENDAPTILGLTRQILRLQDQDQDQDQN